MIKPFLCSTTLKKTGSILAVLSIVFFFQNCGDKGFVSSQGMQEFDSFEHAYPEMNKEGQISSKFEKSLNFYDISPEVEREYSRVFRAVASRPAPTSPNGNLYRR